MPYRDISYLSFLAFFRQALRTDDVHGKLATTAAQSSLGLVEILLIDVQQTDKSAIGDQLGGQGQTQPVGAAGDDGHLVFVW